MTSTSSTFAAVDTSVSSMMEIEKQISGCGGDQACIQALQQSLDKY